MEKCWTPVGRCSEDVPHRVWSGEQQNRHNAADFTFCYHGEWDRTSRAIIGCNVKGARRGIRVSLIVLVLAGAGYGSLHWYIRRSAEETLAAAEAHLRRRENAEAREELQWLLWSDPTHHRALLIRGVSLNADRRFPEAINVLEQIPVDSEFGLRAGTALASALIHDGQWQRAEIVLRKQVDRFPRSIESARQLANLYLSQLRKREGDAVFLAHWENNRDDLSILPDLLDAAARSLAPQDRISRLESAHRRHPGQASVVLAIARAYHQMGNVSCAREHFDAALRLTPDELATKIAIAQFYLDSAEYDSAQILVATVTQQEVNESIYADQYWYLLARLAEAKDQFRESYNFLEKAVELNTQDESYLLMKATLLRRLGRHHESNLVAQEAAQLAATRAQLFVLANELNRESPSLHHCFAISRLMQQLGLADQAAGWRRIGEAVDAAR